MGFPLQTDGGELADGHIEALGFPGHDQRLPEALGDAGGNVRQLRFPAVALADLPDFGRQDHRVQRLQNGLGHISALEQVSSGHGVGAGKDLGAAVASVEDHPFGKDGDTGDGGGAGAAQNSVADDPVVEGQIDGVEACLVVQRLHADVGEQQLGTAGLDIGGIVQSGLRLLRQIDPQILHTVLIQTTVGDLTGMDTDLPARVNAASGLNGVFRHNKTTS